MRPASVVICCLFSLAVPSLFSDIFKGLVGSDNPSISNFIGGLPRDLVDELENNEQQAGQFICQILVNGNIPGALEDLGEDIWSNIEDDWSVVTDFIESLPTLAPEVLEDIIQDGEDVVSVVGELITDPEAALTMIENGVEVVVSDAESVAGDVYTFFECLFGGCSSSSTTADPVATLSSSCQAVLAAATTTYNPVAAATSTYAAAQTSYHETPAAATTSTSETQQQTTATASTQGSGTSGGIGSEGVRMPIVQAWAGLLTCFIFAVVAL